MKNLAEQSYWDEGYKYFEYYTENDSVTKWISSYLNSFKVSNVFEIGCFPGRYLSYFGRKGIEVNGIDLATRIETDFKKWLIKNNIRYGNLVKADVVEYTKKTDEKYDLVCSFGFLKHFVEYEEILLCHNQLLKKDGLLIISTPNFKGKIQYTLHSIFDKENLFRHYIPSMDPFLWKIILEKLGYNIVFCGYFGGFSFWVDKENRSFLKLLILKIIILISKIPGLNKLPNNKLYSPFCGIIAQKNK